MTTKKAPMLRVASVLLVLCLMLSCTVFGSLAKYTSQNEATDSVEVAKWDITIGAGTAGEDSLTDEDDFTFDLFNTVYELGTTEDDTDVDGSAYIAPGTTGSFDLKIKNSSEVTAEYTMGLEVVSNASNIPLLFKLTSDVTGDSTNWTEIENIAELDFEKNNIAIGAEETVTVQWMWAFDEGDSLKHSAQTNDADTVLGVAAQNTRPSVEIKATLLAEQVD